MFPMAHQTQVTVKHLLSGGPPLVLRVSLIAFVAFFAFAIPMEVWLRQGFTGDVWWVWKAGQWMAEHHHILLSDPRLWNGAALAGKPWVNLEWGWEWLLYRTNPHLQPWRFVGLAFLCSLGLLASFSWAIRTVAPRLKFEWVICLYLLYSALFLTVDFKLRAEMFSYLAFPVLLSLLWRGRQDERWLWILWPLTLIWANVHGSWLMIPVLIGLECVAALRHHAWPRALRLLLVLGGVVAVVIGFTPEHLRTITYALWLDRNPEINGHIAEWLSPNFHVVWFSGLAGLALAAGLWRGRQRIAYPFLLDLWLAGIAWMFLDSVRMVTYFGFVLMLWVAYGLGTYPRLQETPHSTGNTTLRLTIWGGLVGAWGLASLVLMASIPAAFLTDAVPTSVMHWMTHHRHGVIFNPYTDGGDLIAHNVTDVYIDGRTDFYLYNGDRFQTYVQVISGSILPGRLAREFQRQRIGWIAWPTKTLPEVLAVLIQEAHWPPLYQAHGWTIYARPGTDLRTASTWTTGEVSSSSGRGIFRKAKALPQAIRAPVAFGASIAHIFPDDAFRHGIDGDR